jgi:serine/threonine protein kinase
MPLSLLPFFDHQSTKESHKPSLRALRQQPNIVERAAPPTITTTNTHALHLENLSLDGCYLNDNIKFIRKIGAGTYGLIYLVEDVITNSLYAAKMVLKRPPKKLSNGAKTIDVAENKRNIQRQLHACFHDPQTGGRKNVSASELNLDFLQHECADCKLLREIALHLRVHDHPNVTTIHKVYNIDKVAIVIMMDYYAQGDLFQSIIDKQIFTKRDNSVDRLLMMKNVILQLIEVVRFCALRGVYHCDLKPENIMVNYNPLYRRTSHSKASILDYNEVHVVLIDFGLAMNDPLVCCNVCRGSSFYMAPERITNYTSSPLIKSLVDLTRYQSIDVCDTNRCTMNRYFPTLAGDIWSLGVLIVNITCARNPWPIAEIESADGNLVFRTYMLKDKSILRAILPISKQFNDFLNRIFTMDPSSRMSLDDMYATVKGLDFFQDHADCIKYEHVESEHSAGVSVFSPGVNSPPTSSWLETPLSSYCHVKTTVN